MELNHRIQYEAHLKNIRLDPDSAEPFWFEKIDHLESAKWVQRHQTTAVYIAVLYVVVTFLGKTWMANRKPYDLRKALIIWNLILAVFSLTGFLRTAPSFIRLLVKPNGIYRSVCTRDHFDEPSMFWAFLFTVSKIFELVDTVFIVLRKAPLLFLHWFHHMSMVVFMFYLYPLADPVGRWGGIINYGIHSIMYSYYALKVMRIRIPKSISKVITTMQMIQFCFAFFATLFAVFNIYLGADCILSKTTVTIQIVGAISYFTLFANYFYQTYFRSKQEKSV